MGFIRGFLAPFRGGIYIARHRLWPYLVVPFVLDVALGIVTMVAAQRYWREEHFVRDLLANAPVIGWIVLSVLTVLGGVILFLIAQPLLLAVFSDRLSERIERDVRGSVPTVPFLASTGWALVHGLLKLVLYGIALVIGLVLTPLLGGLGSLVGVGLGALFLAYDGFDFPLARRDAGFGAKWAYLFRHPAQTAGYGLGATLLYLIPFAVFVGPPFIAAGATLAFMDAEARDGSRRAKPQENPAEAGSGGTGRGPGQPGGNVAANT